MSGKKRNFTYVFFRGILFILLFFIVFTVLPVILLRFINPVITPLMLIRYAGQSNADEPVKIKKEWVSLEEISPQMPIAVVASEDNLFLEHHGFDLDAIEKARDYNDRHKGRRVHGASTISQQTAKNVFLWPQRSWVRKGLEVYFTFLIETFWGKKRIMEVYLNVIETGKGVYGVEGASQMYFHKPASELNSSQAALLAAILPNPQKWDPRYPTAYLRSRQQWILWNMNNIGKVSF